MSSDHSAAVAKEKSYSRRIIDLSDDDVSIDSQEIRESVEKSRLSRNSDRYH